MSRVNKLLIVIGKVLISSLVNRLSVIKYNVQGLNGATALILTTNTKLIF